MKIIVIDNADWSIKYDEIKAIIPVNGLLMEWILEECRQNHFNKDVCYLINVHCVFNTGKEKDENTLSQDQSGVSFYRHLLKLYSDYNKEFKVAFFSPIPKDILLSDSHHPENAILEFYPFIEIPAEWKTFKKEIFSRTEWVKFNNASENLLSGWALNERQPINCSSKKVIFIDDQNEQWKASLEKIFSKTPQGKNEIEVLPYNKEAEPKRTFSVSKLDVNFKSKVKQADLIISDFYLEEDHQDDYWMNRKELLQTSGFKLYNEIKKENKGVPVVMHTLSNKISYYKIFDSYGIDNWFIKDIRANASRNERRENFLSLKNSIEEILMNPYYDYLKDLWKKIVELESLSQKTWWFSNSDNENTIPNGSAIHINEERKTTSGRKYRHQEYWQIKQATIEKKKRMVQIIKSSWYAIRRLMNREVVFEQVNETDLNELAFDPFTPNAICNNLGKCLELLNVESGNKRFSYLTNFLINIRNSASHENDYAFYRLDDAFIYLDYLLKILLFKTKNTDDLDIVNEFRNEWLVEEDGDFIKRSYDSEGLNQYECSLFWIYLQFYNQSFSQKDLKFGRHLLHKRIFELFTEINSQELIHKIISTNDFGPIKKSLSGTGSIYELESTKNKAEIFIKCGN